MKDRILYFYIPYLILFSLGMYYFLSHQHADLVKMMNRSQNDVFNVFFIFITHLGDGVTFGIVIFLLFFFKKHRPLALIMIMIGIAQMIIAHTLKYKVFAHTYRPLSYLPKENLRLIEGIETHINYSFPSGHTITAFTLSVFCIFFLKNKWLWFLGLLFACLIALSRVYLNQHFLIDILGGSYIGVMLASFFFFLFSPFLNNKNLCS